MGYAGTAAFSLAAGEVGGRGRVEGEFSGFDAFGEGVVLRAVVRVRAGGFFVGHGNHLAVSVRGGGRV